MPWAVQVIKFLDREVVREIPCASMREAQAVDRGLTKKLNHADYFTLIVERPESQKGKPCQPTS